MSTSGSEESTWGAVLASVGLFLVTTAVAQWAKAAGKQSYDEVGERIKGFEFLSHRSDDDEDVDMDELRRWYHSRRVHDRLSYENIYDSLLIPAPSSSVKPPAATYATMIDNDQTFKGSNRSESQTPKPHVNGLFDPPNVTRKTAPSSSTTVSEWDLHCRSRTGGSRQAMNVAVGSASPKFTAMERRDSNAVNENQAMHPNAVYDFHPKNRNWRHFEHFNEKDLRRNQQQASFLSCSERGEAAKQNNLVPFQQEMQAPATVSTSKTQCPLHANGDALSHVRTMADTDDEEDAHADSISSSGSESSEEQFVWMKHSHRPSQRRRASEGSIEGPSWPEAFRKRVPCFLNLFKEGAEKKGGNENHAGVDDYKAVADEEELKPIQNSYDTSRKEKVPNRHPTTTPHTRSSIESDYTTQKSSHDDSRPKRRVARRKTLPEISSAPTREADMPTSFPLALQRMWSRHQSSSSDSETQKRSSDPRNVGIAPRLSPRPDPAGPPIAPQNHRQLRAQYNATIMPEKVILIRHGQSMGNINELLYSTTPDNAMPLTQLGWEQARAAGAILKRKILGSGETVHFIVSPYVRTVETFHGIVSAWCDPKEFSHITNKEKRIKAWYRRLMEMGLTWNEDSRIREQDFGNYQDPETIRKAKQERHRFGVFYYRFPHGESASDVFDRVSTFLDSLWRSFEMGRSRNYVLVTHGISIRVLLARYFRYTIDQFNILANPRNCEMVVLGHNGQGRLELQGRCALDLGSQPSTRTSSTEGEVEKKDKDGSSSSKEEELHVTGYKFHKRLRILPRNAIRKVKIRISPDD